jgi:hypothetical protein
MAFKVEGHILIKIVIKNILTISAQGILAWKTCTLEYMYFIFKTHVFHIQNTCISYLKFMYIATLLHICLLRYIALLYINP